MPDRLSLSAARRIALAAQGLARPRPAGAVQRRHLAITVDRLNLLQIDSVNVLARAHYMPLFSRLGPYHQGLLDQACRGRGRLFFEYWAHEASLLPLRFWPLLQWRMERAANGRGIYGGLARFGRERRALVEQVLREVEQGGPIAASDLRNVGEKTGAGGWWGWSDEKKALEWLFWAGRVTTAERRNFERLYDLPERVLPPSILAAPVPDCHDAHRALIAEAARALGIATRHCLRDYFRLSPEDMKGRLEELLEDGTLTAATVEGWPQPAYLHRDARQPRNVSARALLSPFDPVVWERARTESLFDFRYRIEIYTPAHKRQFGYYVLPFLLDDRMAARVDLKADRPAGVLRVLAAHQEPGSPAETPTELAAELRDLASWLRLSAITVEPRGDLAPALASVIERQSGSGTEGVELVPATGVRPPLRA